MLQLIIISLLINNSFCFILPLTFKYWHSITLESQIDKTKPYIYNIGNLPLITWFNNESKPITHINICNHLGSKLSNGQINNNNLICPFHGYKYNKTNEFGTTILHENKIWWSYKPFNNYPYNIPLNNNNKYEKIEIIKLINTNFIDCILSILSINNINIISNYLFNDDNLKNYKIKHFKYNNIKTEFFFHNKHYNIIYKFLFPYTIIIIINKNKYKIIITINLLPLNENKSKIFINIKYNMNIIYKPLLIIILYKIINNYISKLNNLEKTSYLKQIITNNNNEELLIEIKSLFEKYLFPNEYCINHFIKNLRYY